MVHRWASPIGLLACALFASRAWSQLPDQRSKTGHRRGVLGPNEPNPFSQETTIPFTVGDASCPAGTERHVVTLRIYNILSQIVAVGALVDSTAGDPSGNRVTFRPLSNLPLSCGDYAARWDAKHSHNDREAAPGVYMYQLLIDGHPAGMRKMLRR